MRRVILFFILLIFNLLQGQFEPLLYDWDDNLLSQKNGAFVWLRNQHNFSFPALGNQSVAIRHSGFSAYDLFNTNQNDFNLKWQQVLSDLSSSDGLFFHTHAEWFHYRWKKFEYQYGISVSNHAEMWFFHPVSLYRIAAFGFNTRSEPALLREINFNAEWFNRFTFGFTKTVHQDYVFGMNFHLYNSFGNLSSYGNRGSVNVERTGDTYTHNFDNISIRIRAGGLRDFYEKDSVGFPSVDSLSARRRLIRKFFLSRNFGLGFDYGFEKKFPNDWSLTFNLSDAGFIYYTRAYTYKAEGNFSFSGIRLQFPDNPIDYWKQVSKDFDKQIPHEESRRGYFKPRSFKTYLSIKKYYGFEKNDYNAKRLKCYDETAPEVKSKLPYFGIMGFYQNLQGRPYLGAALYWQLFPTRWWDVRLTYAYDTFVHNNLGIATKLRIGKWHLFLSADNILSFRDLSKSAGHEIRFGTYFSF